MLNEIRYKNFKCFHEESIRLANLTVLAGVNGMGKSTVLQSILALRQSYEKSGLRNGLELTGKYTNLGVGQDILYEKSEDDSVIKISLLDDKTIDYGFKYESDATMLMCSNSSISSFSEILTTDQFIYLSANRIIPAIGYDLGNNLDVEKRNFGNTGEYVLQYFNEHGGDEKGFSAESNLALEVNKWMAEITPGVSPVINVNPEKQFADLRFEFREGTTRTRPYKAINVGFGLTYVLPVVVALLTAQMGDYILIENPEAHIHPRGQRKLGELIAQTANKGAQIIMETHSDHIMNGIRLSVKSRKIAKEKIIFAYFYKDASTYEHKCLYPSIDDNGRFDKWPDGFFDEWENSLLELL